MNVDKSELKNIILYTGVYYQDNEVYRSRSPIWFRAFDNAAKLGIKVVVRNDGGLPPEMLERIKAYSNITIVNKENKSDTLGEGRRQALSTAVDIAENNGIANPVFIWTEPEKDDLITEENLLRMVSGIREGAHMVIPERGQKAWEQLPELQKWLEQRAEKRVKDMIGAEETLDLWFGPKVLDRTGTEYFLRYNSEKDKVDLWDSLMVPVLEAVRDKVKVGNVALDFSYDISQTKEGAEVSSREVATKRIEQYAQILKELGDTKWQNYFEDAQGELAKFKELNKDKERNNELIKETKQSLVGKFFK